MERFLSLTCPWIATSLYVSNQWYQGGKHVSNHIAFNQTHPIIIVGDSRGHIQALKLSPNLRMQSREVRQALLNKEIKRAGELEVKKLDAILAQVRDQHTLNTEDNHVK